MYSGVIYLATNLINGNKYVGQTNNFLRRNGNFDHSAIIKCCKNKQNYHKNFKFKYEQIN